MGLPGLKAHNIPIPYPNILFYWGDVGVAKYHGAYQQGSAPLRKAPASDWISATALVVERGLPAAAWQEKESASTGGSQDETKVAWLKLVAAAHLQA